MPYPRYNDYPTYGDTSQAYPRMRHSAFGRTQRQVGFPRMAEYGEAPMAPRMPSAEFAPMGQVPQAPMMSQQQISRQRNMGLAPRGPSSNFRSSALGQQRFGPVAPVAQAPPMTQPSPAPAQPATPKYTSDQLKQLKAYRDRRAKELEGEMDPEKTAAGQKELAGYDEIIAPKPAFLNPAPAAPPATQPAAQPAPRANPPKATLPMSGPEYNKRVRNMYATAAKDLDNNPTLGTQPVPQSPTSVTYGAEAARRAVEMGPDQMRRNEAAILRGGQAPAQQVTERNIGQMEQNQMAATNIGYRGAQFDRGDYALNQPPRAPTAQDGPQYVEQGAQPPMGGNQLSVDQARQFLQQAGGDRAKAEQMARAAGYTF